MKWSEYSLGMKVWWIVQALIFVIGLVAYPLGAIIFALFVWFIVLPVMRAPPAEPKQAAQPPKDGWG